MGVKTGEESSVQWRDTIQYGGGWKVLLGISVIMRGDTISKFDVLSTVEKLQQSDTNQYCGEIAFRTSVDISLTVGETSVNLSVFNTLTHPKIVESGKACGNSL